MSTEKPRISVEYDGNATIVTLVDQKLLEDEAIRELQGSLMSVIEEGGQICLLIDFCNVGFLSSAVLGLLIRVSKKIYESDGQLRLCNINSKIFEVFKITRLTKIFDIHKDREAAIGSFGR
jgi:anti-sigma B factor antagonist